VIALLGSLGARPACQGESLYALYTTKKSPAFTLFGDIRRESLSNQRKRLRTRPRCGIASRVNRSYSPVAPRSESFKPDCEGSSDFCRVLSPLRQSRTIAHPNSPMYISDYSHTYFRSSKMGQTHPYYTFSQSDLAGLQKPQSKPKSIFL